MQGTTDWSSMPTEVLEYVFSLTIGDTNALSRVERVTLSRMSRVCRQWRVLASEPNLWLPPELARTWPPAAQINIRNKEVLHTTLLQAVEFDIEYSLLAVLMRTGVVALLRVEATAPPSGIFVYESLEKMTECFRWLVQHPPSEELERPAIEEYVDKITKFTPGSIPGVIANFAGTWWIGIGGAINGDPHKRVHEILKKLEQNPQPFIITSMVLAVTKEGPDERIWVRDHYNAVGVSSNPSIKPLYIEAEMVQPEGQTPEKGFFVCGYTSTAGTLFFFDIGVHVKNVDDKEFKFQPLINRDGKQPAYSAPSSTITGSIKHPARWVRQAFSNLQRKVFEDVLGNVYVSIAPRSSWRGTQGYWVYVQATRSWKNYTQIEEVDYVIGLGNVLNNTAREGEDALIFTGGKAENLILLSGGRIIRDTGDIIRMLGLLEVSTDPHQPNEMKGRITRIGSRVASPSATYRVAYPIMNKPIILLHFVDTAHQVKLATMAVALDLTKREEGVTQPIAVQLPKNATDFFTRITIEDMAFASNGWMFGVNKAEGSIEGMSPDFQRLDKIRATMALSGVRLVHSIHVDPTGDTQALFCHGSSKGWITTLNTKFRFPIGLLRGQLYSALKMPLSPTNANSKGISCTDTMDQVWACGAIPGRNSSYDTIACLSPETLTLYAWDNQLSDIIQIIPLDRGYVLLEGAKESMYLYNSSAKEAIAGDNLIALLNAHRDLIRDLLLVPPPRRSMLTATQTKIIKDTTGCIWWNKGLDCWGVLDNTADHRVHDLLLTEGINFGPLAKKKLELMVPLGDGVLVADEDGNGGLLQIIAPGEGSRVELVCLLPKVEGKWLPHSFHYESYAKRFWASVHFGWSPPPKTHLFALKTRKTGAQSIKIVCSYPGELMAIDRLGGLWFHNAKQCEWAVRRSPSYSPHDGSEQGQQANVVIPDAEGFWNCCSSIEVGENLTQSDKTIELWYRTRSGVRPIFFREDTGITLGMHWLVKDLLRTHEPSATPTLCSHAGHFKWLIQRLKGAQSSWQDYFLSCHYLAPLLETKPE